MKRIEAIIKPHQLETVKNRLAEIGVRGLTVTEVQGFGRQKGHTALYRGTEYSIDFKPKLGITIVADDDAAPRIVDAIASGARTGTIGDGKIFVVPIDDVVRIRTGEHGHDAI